MEKKQLQECIHCFNHITTEVTDITTDEQRAESQKVVEVTYSYQGRAFKTKPLYYREITGLNDIRDIQKTRNYFGGEVYCLDLVSHDWPQPSGKSDLDQLVIDDIARDDDVEFKSFLKLLANNKQDGFIQKITRDGRPAQYYHNLENNNHWHDLILLIKEVIRKRGQTVDKEFFKPLIYNWDSGRRASLGFNRYGGNYKMIDDLYNNIKSVQMDEYKLEIKNLLQYKKQIILQGPPGTGKTKLAMEIANELVERSLSKPLDWGMIMGSLKVGDAIKTVAGYSTYTVEKLENNHVVLAVPSSISKYIPHKKIINFYNTNKWQHPTENGDDRGAAAIAQFLYKKYNSLSNWSRNDDQLKIIQFHPSYSYEDFVRGIIVKPNESGDRIVYEAEDKILGQFAAQAYANFLDSQEDPEVISNQTWIRKLLIKFQQFLEEKLLSGEKIELTDFAYVTRITNDSVRYQGETWKIDGGVPYSDLEKMYLAECKNLQDIKELSTLTASAKSNATYWLRVLELFQSYLNDNKNVLPSKEALATKATEKNYVLIIDEINRANLSSVLGELIYALEYRGKEVESMYATKSGKQLTLPPNLYIIGTMNTADRSVGNIDYAIRRRFAFVNILPEDLSQYNEVKFHSDLFKQVSKLFISNFDDYQNNPKTRLIGAETLSPEFEPKDVWLGHSYFIDKSNEGGSMAMRLQYEIKPILSEYVKDGILIGEDVMQRIEALNVK